MGIKGIYNEIGPGDRIALSKLAAEFFEENGRPLRLAIDISIWLFQIQAGEGGTNPALRTFYYRLLRLISLSIHPVFVFDGPNKPPFKRHKRTMAPGVKTVSIPEFLAKQLLKHFALPTHLAPGEAEAECALLQRLGFVDAVLSEDADALMFGSGLTLRNLSPEGSLKAKVATHVNVYDAEKVKANSGLDRDGMILVALMSGGDYIPEGIPGCGPKTACQAARAGFGRDLCRIKRDDHGGLALWKERLTHELHTNETKLFNRKNPALKIPDDFPRRDILRFYTHPCISSDRALNEQLPQELQWDREIDFRALRTFAGDAFEWFYVSGAKKFIRNLAPALLVKELRLRGPRLGMISDDIAQTEQQESQLIKSIHMKRNHVSTDRTPELRIGFIPIDLVPLDLNSETPDPETMQDVDLEEEGNIAVEDNDEPTSPRKMRGPSVYEPTSLEKIWLLESFVRVGTPLKVQDWEESVRNVQKVKESKVAKGRERKSPNKPPRSGMLQGAMDPFTKVTKPGVSRPKVDCERNIHQLDSTEASLNTLSQRSVTPDMGLMSAPIHSLNTFRAPPPLPKSPPRRAKTALDCNSSREPMGASAVSRSSKVAFSKPPDLPLSLSQSNDTLRCPVLAGQTSRLPLRPSTPNRGSPQKTTRQPVETVNLCSSPSTPKYRQRSITEWASPQKSPMAASKSSRIGVGIRTTEAAKEGINTTSRAHPSEEKSHGLVNTSIPLQPQFQRPTQFRPATVAKGTGGIISLRESLDGAWQVQKGSSAPTIPPSGDEDEEFWRRKRRRKQWRVSQVDTLDLTNV